MKPAVLALALAALAGCGVETAGTAATGAQLKKQELEEGRRTQQRAEQRIDQATQIMQERAQKLGDAEGR